MRKKALLIVVMATLAVLLVLPASAFAYALVWKTPGTGDYGPDLTRVADVQVYMSSDWILHVTMTALPGYRFLETQMAVGRSLNDTTNIPQNRGGPIPGRFPVGDSWPVEPPKTVVAYEFDTYPLGLPPHTIVLHAVVMGDDGTIETAWGTECWADYYDFPGKNWARWLPYPAWH